jgi:hypothetical protein
MDTKMIPYEQMTKKQKDKVDGFARKYLIDLLDRLVKRLDASLPSPGNGYAIEFTGPVNHYTGESCGELAVNDVEFIEKQYKVNPSFWKSISNLKDVSEAYLHSLKA